MPGPVPSRHRRAGNYVIDGRLPQRMAASPAASEHGSRSHASIAAPAATAEGVFFVNLICR